MLGDNDAQAQNFGSDSELAVDRSMTNQTNIAKAKDRIGYKIGI